MNALAKLAKEFKDKENNKDLYNKVAKIRKLNINDLEKILSEALEKEGYVKFELDKPEIGQYVIVSFSVRDEKSDRSQYDSESSIKKLIKSILKDTNWRLMSDGVSYRVGFIVGRFKCYEREEGLIKLVK